MPSSQSPAQVSPSRGRRSTVLVVEDDDAIRDLICTLLRDEGYHVDEAAGGDEALAYVRRGGRPALMLLDLVMVDTDGWQVIAELAASPELAAIPVVAMSAVSETWRAEVRPRVSDVLEKPLDLKRLLQIVASRCERRHGAVDHRRGAGSRSGVHRARVPRR